MQPHRMLFGVLLVWVAVSIQHSVADEKTGGIESISPEQIKDLKESVSLKCKVNNPINYTVAWHRIDRDRTADADMMLSIGEMTTLLDKRISVEVSEKNTLYTLHIRDLQPQDSALYECQLLVSTNEKVKRQVELLIRTPAQVDSTEVVVIGGVNGGSIGSSSSGSAPRQNQTAELRCKARGYPRATLHWYRDGDELLPAGNSKYMGSVLTLVSVQPQDRGLYYCQAENGIGGPHRAAVQVQVQFKPVLRTLRPRVAQATGYDIEMQCIVEAYPAPEIRWLRRYDYADLTVRPYDGFEFETNAGTNDVTVSVMRKRDVENKDYGMYFCQAINTEGVTRTELELYNSKEQNFDFVSIQPERPRSAATKNVVRLMLPLVIGYLVQ